MGPDFPASNSVSASEENDKEEVIFENPGHHYCPAEFSALSSWTSLSSRRSSEAVKRQPSSDEKPCNDCKIIPWAAFQTKIMESRRRGSSSFEPNESSKAHLEDLRLQSGSGQKTAELRRELQISEVFSTDMTARDSRRLEAQSTNIQESRTLPISSSSISPHAALETADLGGDKSLLDFESFVSSNGFTKQSSNKYEQDRDKTVGNIINDINVGLKDEKTVEHCLQSLQNIAVDGRTRGLLATSGGIQAVINAIKLFPSNEKLQEHGITLLAEICQCRHESKLQVGHSRGIQVIISSMRSASQESLSLIERCCETLSICCDACEFNQLAAGEGGAVDEILSIMRRGRHTMTLQEKCVQALHALVKNNAHILTFLKEGGGVQEVLATIRFFSTEETIQIGCMQLMLEILRQSNDMRCCLGNSGLIEDIETHFSRYSASSRYVASTSGCIRYLAFNVTNRAYFATGNMIPNLMGALHAWIDDEEVVLRILFALGNMTFDSARAKSLVARDRGASSLVSVLSKYKTHTCISEQTCRVLRNLADGKPKTKRQCIRSGALNALARAIQSLPGAAGVQEQAAAALYNLSSMCPGELRNIKLEEHVNQTLVLHQGTPAAAQQLLHLQMVLGQLRNRPMFFRYLFGGTPVVTPRTIMRPPAEDVFHAPSVVSAVEALSHHGDKTEY